MLRRFDTSVHLFQCIHNNVLKGQLLKSSILLITDFTDTVELVQRELFLSEVNNRDNKSSYWGE